MKPRNTFESSFHQTGWNNPKSKIKFKEALPYFRFAFQDGIDYKPRKLLDFEEYRQFLTGILNKNLPFILNLKEIVQKQEDQYHSLKLNNHNEVLKAMMRKVDFKLAEVFDRHTNEKSFLY